MSTKCAAGLTRKGLLEGGNLKSMMVDENGGQQFVGSAPSGRSGGPHVVRSGGDIGAANAKGLLLRVAAPQSPPRPSRMFLLCGSTSSPDVFGFWLSLHVTLGI